MNLRAILTFLASTVTLRNCGNPSIDQATITSMGFFPTNPTPNQDTELWVAYDLRSEITGGTATYSYNYNGIPFSPTSEDLCSQTSCPKAVGTYNETSKSTFPSGISGKVVTKIQWTNQDSQPIWCVELTFKI
jgi:hypothetical protein